MGAQFPSFAQTVTFVTRTKVGLKSKCRVFVSYSTSWLSPHRSSLTARRRRRVLELTVDVSAPLQSSHSRILRGDNKGIASALMLVEYGATWTTEPQAIAEIFDNHQDSRTTRGHMRRAHRPLRPPLHAPIQYAGAQTVQPNLSAGTLVTAVPPCLSSSSLASSRSTFLSWAPSLEPS